MNVFKEYVTSTAFKLSLSKVQIECLSQIDQIGKSWMHLSTFHALSGKGLVERIESEYETNLITVTLTDAGKSVIPLLKLSGLYVEIPKWDDPVVLPEIVITLKDPA